VQTAFARIGLDWHDAKIISGHHNLILIQDLNLNAYNKIAILAGNKDLKPWLSELLSNLEYDVDIFICENLTLENETVRNIKPSQIDQIQFSSRTIILIINKENI
jgi:precorrin-6B methylase 1